MALKATTKEALRVALADPSAADDVLGQMDTTDDVTFTLGSNDDIVLVSRSTSLGANTALTGVLIGTPVTAATPADTLLISNVTANGDIAIFLNDGSGNSWEWERFDSSAGLHVVNEAGNDIDYRIEGDNNANMLVIDAGTDSLAHGAAVTAGAFFSVDGSAVNRAGVTSVGRGEHFPAATFTQTNAASTTLAVTSRVFMGIPTFAGANASQTLTDASTLWIAGAAAAGTNVTITNRPTALNVAAGKVAITPTATVASGASADLTGFSVPATTVTLTGTTQVTAAQGLVNLAQPTLTDASAVTVDTYATLYIANAPTAAGSVTLTEKTALWVDAGATRLDGTTYIGDNSNATVTLGLTINQGAADDSILELKSSDVTHGVTTVTETDTYGLFRKYVANNGGLEILGLDDTGDTGLALTGVAVTANSTRSTSGAGAIMLKGHLKSGTGLASIGADKNILTVSDNGTVRFLLDTDGDSFQDVGTAWTNFDDHDDLVLLNSLAHHVSRPGNPVSEQFGGWLSAKKEELEALKLVSFNDDTDGHAFVNMSKLTMLLVGAVRQGAARIAQLENLVAKLLPAPQ